MNINDRLLNPETIKKQKLSNGEEISYRELGKELSKVIIFIHGTLVSSILFDPLSKLSVNFRIIAIDLRGFGKSSNNKEISTLDDFALDLILLLKELKIDKIYLVGISLGGGIAMKLAANYPNIVEKMILIGPLNIKGLQYKIWNKNGDKKIVAKNIEELKNCYQMSSFLKILEKKNDIFIKEILKECFACEDEVLFKEFVNSAIENVNYLFTILAANKYNIGKEFNDICYGTEEIFNIKCQCLILHGENDRINKICFSEEIENILGNKCKLKIIEAAGHIPFLEKPYLIINLVENFILEKK